MVPIRLQFYWVSGLSVTLGAALGNEDSAGEKSAGYRVQGTGWCPVNLGNVKIMNN